MLPLNQSINLQFSPKGKKRIILFCIFGFMFKKPLLIFSLGLSLCFFASCNKLKANEIKNDLNAWVQELITPANTTLEKVENGFVVSGNLKNQPKHLLILWELTPSQLIFIDSTRTDENGNFNLKGNTKEMIFCQLQMGPETSAFLALENNSKLKLNIELNGNLVKYDVKGNETDDSKTLKTLLDKNVSFISEVRSLEEESKKIPQTQEGAAQAEVLRNRYTTLVKQRDEFVMDLALKQKKGFIPYFIITFGALQNPGFDLFKHAVTCAKAADENSKYTQGIITKFNSEAKLMIGAQAPEINLKQPDGKPFALSSLKGKVVLIDFWASWCGPCRRENPNVTRVYAKYKNRGFEILGVSLDQDATRWKGAIKADNLTWIHVSDLMGWQSSAAQLYDVHSIPQTILLDKEGRILAKGLRGEELEAKLESLLGTPVQNENTTP